MGASGSAVSKTGDEVDAPPQKIVTPESEIIQSDLSSRIELSLRLEGLTKVGSVFLIIYTKLAQDTHWQELGKTENNLENIKAPQFKRTFMVDFTAENQRLMRLEAYRMRDINLPDDMAAQKFLGSVQVYLVEIMIARSNDKTAGWLVKELLHPTRKKDEPSLGRLCIYAEEDPMAKTTLSFVLAGRGVKSSNFWKRQPDPYFVINRSFPVVDEDGEEELECKPVFRSEVVRKAANPRWKSQQFLAMMMCSSKADRDIVIEVYDWFRVSGNRYIGECVVSLGEFQKAFREARPLIRPICVREGKRTGLFVKKATSRTKSKTSVLGGMGRSKSRVQSKISAGSDAMSTKRSAMASKESLASRTSGGSMASKASRGTARSARSAGTGVGSIGSAASMASKSSTGSGRSMLGDPQIFGKVVGELVFEELGVLRAYTFLDYIRGGLELKLAVAIDMTRSNVGPELPGSKHHLDPGGADSSYSTAIKAVGDVIRSYDADDKYPVYGFGAQIPPTQTVTSDCFALSGDFWDPEVNGIEGIILAYKRSLHVARLHGPTHIHEVIKLCANMARPYAEAQTPPINGVDMKYFVFLILTDGDVHQQEQVIDEILKSVDLPMSIVIIGIGDGDFTFLQTLAEDVGSLRQKREEQEAARKAQLEKAKDPRVALEEAAAAAKKAAIEEALSGGSKGDKNNKKKVAEPKPPLRDIVHFVAYKDYQGRPMELAAEALRELPREVCGYFTAKGVKPRNLDKMEDDAGNPLPKVIPSATSDGSKSRVGTKDPRAGTKDAASRSTTKLSTASGLKSGVSSRASSTLTTPDQRAEEELKKRLGDLPPFLQEERDRLFKEAKRLGYEDFQISRAFREGVPAATVEALVDNIVHSGYGKSPSYRSAAEAAIPDTSDLDLVTLPVLPNDTLYSTSSSADFDFGSTGASTPGSGIEPPMPLLSMVDFPSSPMQSPVATKEGWASNSRFSTKDGQSSMTSYGPGAGRSVTTLTSLSGGETARERPSKQRSILKSVSREASKDFAGIEPWSARHFSSTKESMASARHFSSTKESMASARHFSSTKESMASTSSLRSAAFVRFSDEATRSSCGVCFEAEVTVEFQPCGHRIACARCAAKLRGTSVCCPLCQAVIQEVRPLQRMS